MGWSFNSVKPIYLQIADKIEKEILSGKLKKGERLMSVRDLAIEASVNPNTVQRAMQELEARKLVSVSRTSGRQVTDDDGVITGARNKLANESVKEFCSAMKKLGFTSGEIIKTISEEW